MTAPKPKSPQARSRKAPASTVARQAEAEDGYVTLEQCGVKLRIPVGGKITVAAIDAYRDGDNYEGTKQLLGKEQWKLLSDAGMTADDLDELGEKLKAASGN